MAEIESLTAKQATFVTAYLTPGLTIEAAAKVAGVTESTAHRWLKLAQVKDGIKQARADLYEQAMGGLVHLIEKGVKTLDDAMDRAEFPGTQVRAAQIVIEQSTAIYKTAQLEQEIEELKRIVSGLDET